MTGWLKEGRLISAALGLLAIILLVLGFELTGSALKGYEKRRSHASNSQHWVVENKIRSKLYLMTVYDSPADKLISKSTARAYLHVHEYANKSTVAFQNEAPAGTLMSLVGPVPKPRYLFFSADQYFVPLDPDLARGLELTLQLDRKIDGDLDGLNAEKFNRLE